MFTNGPNYAFWDYTSTLVAKKWKQSWKGLKQPGLGSAHF